VDLQAGFQPDPKMVEHIQKLKDFYPVTVSTEFRHGNPLYASRLDWVDDPGRVLIQGQIHLTKTGYGLNYCHLQKIKNTGYSHWDICGMEGDACVLACAFSLWDAHLVPYIQWQICGGGNQAIKRLAQRQFGIVPALPSLTISPPQAPSK
jgi:hypothetical protein